MSKQVPEGYHTVTPALTVKDGAEAIAFYKRAFGAQEIMRMAGPEAKVLMPVTDMFWGDRFGQVEDPSGHRWGLATHVEDPSPEEIARRHREFVASMAKK